MQNLEKQGVIERRVALLDPEQLGLGITALVNIRTNQHSASWLNDFQAAIADLPEIVEAVRTMDAQACEDSAVLRHPPQPGSVTYS